MNSVRTIFLRELKAYFATPLAYVYIVIFLALTGSLTFFLGGFFERGQADLAPFFLFHPWLYLFLVPAIAMRLWAEERRTGTIELLMTLPTTTFARRTGSSSGGTDGGPTSWPRSGRSSCGRGPRATP